MCGNYYDFDSSCRSEDLLCPFHVLQAIWMWISVDVYGIAKHDRPELFGTVQKLMYAKTEADLLYA